MLEPVNVITYKLENAGKLQVDYYTYDELLKQIKKLEALEDVYNSLSSIDACFEESLGSYNRKIKTLNTKAREITDVLKELIEATNVAMSQKYKNYYDAEIANVNIISNSGV